METINDKSEITDLSIQDTLPVWDTSAVATRKVSIGDLIDLAIADLYPQEWAIEKLVVDLLLSPMTYDFVDTQQNILLYVYDATVSNEDRLPIEVTITLPPSPTDGQEVIITFDMVKGGIALIFDNAVMTGTENNLELQDATWATFPAAPYLHIKYNTTNNKWWKLSMRDDAEYL